jgi:hypothetical protein
VSWIAVKSAVLGADCLREMADRATGVVDLSFGRDEATRQKLLAADREKVELAVDYLQNATRLLP